MEKWPRDKVIHLENFERKRAGEIPLSLLEDRAIQDWLAPRLSEAIRSCWVGDAEGRLKPLMLHLPEGAPDGLDYTQLRLGIARWKDKQAEG